MRHEHTGYLRVSGPDGTVERDGFRCNHCQHAIIVKPDKGCDSPKMRLDRCGQCHATICPNCAAELVLVQKCRPYERRLEEQEARARLRRAAGV